MIRLGLKFNPLRSISKNGPDVFTNRLVQSFIKNSLFEVKSGLLPNFDVGLYNVTPSKYIYYNKIPFFLRLDGIYHDTKKTYKYGKILNERIRQSIKNAKGIIFISQYCKTLCEKILNIKISIPNIIIYNRAPENLFKPQGNNYRSKLNYINYRVLIAAGNWRRHKRLHELIKFLKILNQKKTIYKLIVLGKINKEDLELIKDSNIYYVGEISPEELPAWYRTADVYLHMSWIEPSGNTQMEAMACGVPILCCNNGGIGETVKEFTSGLISNVDKKYEFNWIDFYDPPEPDYVILKKDLETIFDNLNAFKKKIDFKKLRFINCAKNYASFIEKNIL